MQMTHYFAAAFLGLAGITPTAGSAADPVGNPIIAEVLPGWQQADGTRVAAIKFTLAPGWKTYWRAPGDGGIPPQLSWSGSKNLAGVSITWPSPKVFNQNGLRTIGYENELVLPLTISPQRDGKPIKLAVEVDLGVCNDICMPQTLRLKATLDTTENKPTPAIAAALAARPYGANEAGVRAATCALSPNADGLEIKATLTMPDTGGREIVIIEPGNDTIWMSETDTKRRGNTLTARGDMMAYAGGPLAIDRSAIRITVLGKRQSVEIKGCAPG